MDQTILFIDGENFIHKIEDVLRKHPKGNKVDVASFNFNKIFRSPLQEYKITRKIFYADKLLKTAILCSSDSDLQPAVQEAKKRGIEVVYLGFGFQPNKGLMYTTNATVVFRDAEILKACGIN
jgi:DNA-binding LacI/PurR family transcriptional regulator